MAKQLNTSTSSILRSTAGKRAEQARKSIWREWLEFGITLVLMVFFIRVTTVEAFRIPTGSMEDTLLVGDFLLVNKYIYGIHTPDWIGIPFTQIGFHIPSTRLPSLKKVSPGDIIVFKYPKDTSLNYIKRCVAIPGQTVQIRNKQLYVDGQLFENPPLSKYLYPSRSTEEWEPKIYETWKQRWNHDNFGPITVPAGLYFAMGDNRDNSEDSRYWGFVPQDNIVGKALVIYFSWNGTAPLYKFYDKIRWSRVTMMIH